MLPNQTALCAVIKYSEGTIRADDPYRVCFGFSHTIISFANHPAITGEWLGAHYNGELTTAAGAYQINRPSWKEGAAALGLNGPLMFSPANQDAWVLWKVKQMHAFDMLNRGDISGVLGACRDVWASFPGGSSGQPEAHLANLVEVYTNAGGLLG